MEIENTNTNTINKKTEYFKKWALENAEKLKQSRQNWYNTHRDDEDYKNRRKEYNKLYYLKRKNNKNNNENE